MKVPKTAIILWLLLGGIVAVLLIYFVGAFEPHQNAQEGSFVPAQRSTVPAPDTNQAYATSTSLSEPAMASVVPDVPGQNTSELPPSETPAVAVAVPQPAFVETFDGAPATAQPWQPTDWDLAVHSRDAGTFTALELMHAQHDGDCSAPSATHEITRYQDAVFQCRNHVMTAMKAEGYGAIYLTPHSMVDFSQGEAVMRWDMSTLRTSARDWVDLWITPYEDNLQLPLEGWRTVDLQGPPRNAVHVRMDTFNGKTLFYVEVVRDYVAQQVPGSSEVYEDVLTPDAARRDTFELRISRTHLSFGMPQYNLNWVNADIAALGWDMGVVQLGYHSYNPEKDAGCQLAGQSICTATTFHWDNVQIGPAKPFTSIKGQPRMVSEANAPAVTFPSPAPANARLRFSALGTNIQVSFDGGKGWEAAQVAAEEHNDQYHAHSYWTPVPKGVSSVLFRGEAISNLGWHAQDFAIWSN